MPQNRETGAEANKFGRETAKRIAEKLKATNMSARSNECSLNGRRVVIKCAREDTNSVGVTYKMLERVEEIIGAFESGQDEFYVFGLSPSEFKQNMRPTRSKGASSGKGGIVKRQTFEKLGKPHGRVSL